MNSEIQSSLPLEKDIRTIHKIGFWSAILLVIFSVVTFGIAVFTPADFRPLCHRCSYNISLYRHRFAFS